MNLNKLHFQPDELHDPVRWAVGNLNRGHPGKLYAVTVTVRELPPVPPVQPPPDLQRAWERARDEVSRLKPLVAEIRRTTDEARRSLDPAASAEGAEQLRRCERDLLEARVMERDAYAALQIGVAHLESSSRLPPDHAQAAADLQASIERLAVLLQRHLAYVDPIAIHQRGLSLRGIAKDARRKADALRSERSEQVAAGVS